MKAGNELKELVNELGLGETSLQKAKNIVPFAVSAFFIVFIAVLFIMGSQNSGITGLSVYDNSTNETINETVVNETVIVNDTIVNETAVNDTIVDVNETLNETLVNDTIIDEPVVNDTIVNDTASVNETIINETIDEPIINEITNITSNETGDGFGTMGILPPGNETGGNYSAAAESCNSYFGCGSQVTLSCEFTNDYDCCGSGYNYGLYIDGTDYITIDFNGYTMENCAAGTQDYYGIYAMNNADYLTIIDADIEGFTDGVHISNSDYLNISGGDFSFNGPEYVSGQGNQGYGIYLYYADNFNIKDVNVSYIRQSNGGYGHGIAAYYTNNGIVDNAYGIGDDGAYNGYGFYAEYSSDYTIKNSYLEGYGERGMNLAYTIDRAVILNNTLSQTKGVYIYDADDSVFADNTVAYSTYTEALYISSGTNNTFRNNTIRNSSHSGTTYGIYFTGTNHNFEENTIEEFYQGIYSSSSTATGNYIQENSISENYYGIYLSSPDSNYIIGNTIQENSFGIALNSAADSNIIINNSIFNNNNHGLYIYSGSSNQIYNNYFSNPSINARNTGTNSWSTSQNCSQMSIVGGPCMGGNYWGNPSGTGYSQTCLNDTNAFCTIQYSFLTGGIDYLPLTALAPTHTTPILNSTCNLNTTLVDLQVYNQSTSTITSACGNNPAVKNIIDWYVDGMDITVLKTPFDIAGNPTEDYSSYENDGNVYNALWHQCNGYDGWGTYEFEGTSTSRIQVPDDDSLDLTEKITVEAWVKTNPDIQTGYGTLWAPHTIDNASVAYGSYGINPPLSPWDSNYIGYTPTQESNIQYFGDSNYNYWSPTYNSGYYNLLYRFRLWENPWLGSYFMSHMDIIWGGDGSGSADIYIWNFHTNEWSLLERNLGNYWGGNPPFLHTTQYPDYYIDETGYYVYVAVAGADQNYDIDEDYVAINKWYYPYAWPELWDGDVVSKGESAYALRIENEYAFRYLGDTTVHSYINGNEISASIGDPSLWHHLVMTYDGAEQSLYIDGVLANSYALSGLINTNTQPIYIGRDFPGFVDDVRVYNWSLSEEQVWENYNSRYDVLVSEETTTGETWTACIIPHNGLLTGAQLCSNNLTIITPYYLDVWDETDNETFFDRNLVRFFAEYYQQECGYREPLTGAGLYCSFTENSSEIMAPYENMTYNSTSGYHELDRSFIDPGTYGFNVSCYGGDEGFSNRNDSDSFTTINRNITYSEFNGTETTDMANIDDPTNILKFVLANGHGKIEWHNSVNATDNNFDSAIDIAYNYLDVRAENLHESFNSSANITLYDLPIFEVPEPLFIQIDGVRCGNCQVVQITGDIYRNITFNVTHFSNYSIESVSQLDVWDTTDSLTTYEYQPVTFFADFKDSEVDIPIFGAGAYCELIENSSGVWSDPIPMTYANSYGGESFIYYYTASEGFPTSGNFSYNITCNGTSQGYAWLREASNFTITHDDEPPNSTVRVTSTNSNRSDGDIRCRVTATDDVREIMTIYYNWKINGTDAGRSGVRERYARNGVEAVIDTVPASFLDKYDNWTCEVFANDWVNNETPAKEANITIRNALPRIEVSFTNTEDYIDDINGNITCWAEVSDPDEGDNILKVNGTLTWINVTNRSHYELMNSTEGYWSNGDLFPLYNLSSNDTFYNEIWVCNVSVNDTDITHGEPGFSWASASVEFLEWTSYWARDIAPDTSAFEPVAPIGVTTNFSINVIYVQEGKLIGNYTNAVFGNSYGTVKFFDPINYTMLNVSEGIFISQNNFMINTTGNMSGFADADAQITFYNLSLVYPWLYYSNGTECDACSFVSYSGYGGVYDLTFNVSGFVSDTTTIVARDLAPDVSAFDSHTSFSINDLGVGGINDVTDMYVENSTFGKIQFLEPVNATLLDLSSAINISYRSIAIDTSNSTIYERLDIPADITLYGTNLTYPVIRRGGLVCPDYVCAFDYYDNSFNIKFNVTGFEFTPSTAYNLTEGAPNVTLFNGTSTTNFSRIGSWYGDFDIQEADVALEKEGLGKIVFLEPIDVLAGNTFDWDSNIDIAVNGNIGKYVFINTTSLPNLDKPANITLYNLHLVNPVVRYENSTGGLEECPAEKCIPISYSSTPEACKSSGDCTFEFWVNNFSSQKYRAMEDDTSPYFIEPISEQIWFENNERTIENISQYVFDPDNFTLIYGAEVDCGSNMSAVIDPDTTNITFTPAANWTGLCIATLNVSDGESADHINVTLRVTSNIPPQFISGPISVDAWGEDSNQTLNLGTYFWDPDGDDLTFNYIFLLGGNITVDLNESTGVVRFIPDSEWYGQRSIKFSASDEADTTWSAPYTTLVVNSVNDLPFMLQNIPNNIQSYVEIDEDTNYTLDLSSYFDDVEDGNDLMFSLAEIPSNFNVTLNSTTNIMVFTPGYNWYGSENFTITAQDTDGGNISSNQFIIYVAGVHDGSVALNASLNLTWIEDTSTELNISEYFYDADNDLIYLYTYLNASPSIIVSMDPFIGFANLTPADNFFGVEYVNFSATDGISTSSMIVRLEVTNVGDDPIVSTIPDQAWNEDNNLTIDLSNYFLDVDLEGLDYTIITFPENINVSVNDTTERVMFVPDSNWNGITSIQFRAEDLDSNTVTSNVVELEVYAVNDPPTASTIPSQTTIHDRNITINLNNYFTDIENDGLSYTSVYGDNVTISIAGATATIEPDPSFIGTRWAIFTADDASDTTDSNNVTLNFVESGTILVNTMIEGTLYPDGEYLNLSDFVGSNLTDSSVWSSTLLFCRVEDSEINGSTMTGCTIISSTVRNYACTNCIVNDSTVLFSSPGNITESEIYNDSILLDSNVTYSDVEHSNITNSTGTNCVIRNSYIRNSQFADCVITEGTIYSGTITFNGTVYDADGSGSRNLTDIINYIPAASFEYNPSSPDAGENITFNSTSTDPNIPGILNDNLTYFWDFGDGENSTNSTPVHSYPSETTYTVSLTVNDSYGEQNTITKSVTVGTVYTPPSSSGGGGGGRRTTICTELWNCTAWDPCTPYGIQYRTCYDTNNCGTYTYMPIGDQACDYTPTCTDFVLNQDETDVDCGGSCSPCLDERSCVIEDDCQNSCLDGICGMAPPPPPPPPLPPPPPPPPPPVVEKPLPVKLLGVFTSNVGGVPVWTYIAGILAAGLLLGGGLFVGKRKLRKLEEVPSYTWLDSLMTAIKRDVIRGVPEPDIRRSLLDIGWPAHIVNQSIREINKAMLGAPVEKDITLGFDETKLKGALMRKGWPETTVSRVIDDVNISILRKTMEYNFAKGYNAKKIGKGMVAAGWPEDMVSKVVKEFRSLK